MPDASSPAYAALPDAWEPSPPIPLDGVLERHRFGPLLTAFFALVAGLLLFQGLSAVAVVVLLALRGVDLAGMMADLPAVLEQHADLFITANTIGQALGLAVPAFLLARLHARRATAFLRLRTPDALMLVLAVVGLLALTPVVQWAGTLNEALPLPEALREWDRMQMELVEKVLLGRFSMTFSLVMLALTPALCEELLFRGYVQRQAERGLGAAGGILASGLIFGLYHLRLTQLLPLSLLGLYLAFLAWRTGSLWVPVAVHFFNNAFAVAAAAYVSNRPDLDISSLEQIDVPWYIALGGLALFAVVGLAMRRRARLLLAPRRAPDLA